MMRRLLHPLLVVPACAACDPAPTELADSPGIAVVSGAGQRDTIDSRLSEPLVLRVTGANGRAAAGVELNVRAETYTSWLEPLIRVAAEDSAHFRPALTLRTDAAGTAQVRVALGRFAGSATLQAEAPLLGFSTTASYSITPGHAFDVRITPRDTSLYAGASYLVRTTGVDRRGNPRPEDRVVLSVADAGVASLEAGLLQGQAIGRTTISAQHEDGFTDSAFVSVVPAGQIVALRAHAITGDTARLVYSGLDGSGYNEVDTELWDSQPIWLVSGEGVLVVGRGPDAYLSQVVIIDAAGRRSLVPSSTGLAQTTHPDPGKDGWIYFSGDPGEVGQNHSEIWRIRPDGTGAERIGDPAGYYVGDHSPSISSDGEKLAYVTTRDSNCCGNQTLRVRTLPTGADVDLGTNRYAPSFSPTDPSLLVFGVERAGSSSIFDMEIYAIRADGTGMRRISPAGRAYRTPFRWSPDGRWLIAQDADRGVLELIEVSTGQVLPLAFSASPGMFISALSAPSWKP